MYKTKTSNIFIYKIAKIATRIFLYKYQIYIKRN